MDKKEPYITTRTGQVVHFLSPKTHQIKIHDIVWHLARQCRFNGHMDVWYSNAEHLIMCSKQASNVKVAREALIHDFSEYVFCDISSPIKRLIPQYKELEDNFQQFLNFHFLRYFSVEDEVKTIDSRMCATEQKILRKDQCQDWEVDPYLSLTRNDFKCYEWRDAYFAFMDVFQKLFPGYRDA